MAARGAKSTTSTSSRSNAKKSATASASKRSVKKSRTARASRPREETVEKKRSVGRPIGSGKYGEPTKALRLPVSLIEQVDSFVKRRGFVFPLYSNQIQAGFPSPAEDDVPFEPYDLGAKLIPNPASTFFIRVTGESMRDAGIFPDDVLIVDRSLEARSGDVVVAAINGEFTVKRLYRTTRKVELRPENAKFRPIVVTDDMDFIIWGVVKTVIHNL